MTRRYCPSAVTFVLLGAASAGLVGCKERAPGLSEEKHYSNEASLVEVEFDGYLFFSVPVIHQGNIPGLLSSDYRPEIENLLATQLDYLTGSFLNHKPFADRPGSVYGKPEIKIKSVEAVAGQSSLVMLRYSYKDRGSFHKAIVDAQPIVLDIKLPAVVQGFYERAKTKDGKTLCLADQSHRDKDKFWYYWNAEAAGCQLNAPDVLTLKATLRPLPQTRQTKPWYDELLGKPGQPRKTLKVSLIFGDSTLTPDDKATLDEFKARGFTVKDVGEGVSRYSLIRPHVDIEMDVQSLRGGSAKFKAAAARGISEADVFIYSGHSSYGSYLDPALLGLTNQSFNQNKAQVFYFAGCRSFRYYNSKFFDLKPNKLNIVTNSVPAYSLTFREALPEFLMTLTDQRRLSWQQIIDQVQAAENRALTNQKADGAPYPYIFWPKFKGLIAVNGDENNPTD